MPERGEGPTREGEAGAGVPPAPAGGLASPRSGLTAERYRSVFASLHEGMAYCQMFFDGDRPSTGSTSRSIRPSPSSPGSGMWPGGG